MGLILATFDGGVGEMIKTYFFERNREDVENGERMHFKVSLFFSQLESILSILGPLFLFLIEDNLLIISGLLPLAFP